MPSGARLTMREAMREVLHQHLASDRDVVLLGEDIEDPKGDVFGVTRGLSTQFPQRVRNAALTESTIVGTCIGQALTGKHPVAFIQFADFLPVAFNQIACELGSLYWRSDGHWQAPVIRDGCLRCLSTRTGAIPRRHARSHHGAHAGRRCLHALHRRRRRRAAQRRLRLAAAHDFLLSQSAAERSGRSDAQRRAAPVRAHRHGAARAVGSRYHLRRLGQHGADLPQSGRGAGNRRRGSDVLDLRTLSPWDERAVLASAEQTARLIVVHEDNHTCGFGAEVLATVAEKTRVPVAMRRVTRPDTYIPCHFENQIEVLPSFKRVLSTAAELLNLELQWEKPAPAEEGLSMIEAVGSGPADETVIVSELFVSAGQMIRRGEVVAALEATKSVFELTSPFSGRDRRTLCRGRRYRGRRRSAGQGAHHRRRSATAARRPGEPRQAAAPPPPGSRNAASATLQHPTPRLRRGNLLDRHRHRQPPRQQPGTGPAASTV